MSTVLRHNFMFFLQIIITDVGFLKFYICCGIFLSFYSAGRGENLDNLVFLPQTFLRFFLSPSSRLCQNDKKGFSNNPFCHFDPARLKGLWKISKRGAGSVDHIFGTPSAGAPPFRLTSSATSPASTGESTSWAAQEAGSGWRKYIFAPRRCRPLFVLRTFFPFHRENSQFRMTKTYQNNKNIYARSE